jgi:hypothetical protein
MSKDKLDLFAVRTASKEVLNTFFTKKTEAKAVRDDMVKEGKEAFVTKGPDHRDFNPATSGLRAAIEKRQRNRKRR